MLNDYEYLLCVYFFFFFQAEDGIRDGHVTGVQTCALPIYIETTDANAVLFDAANNFAGCIPGIHEVLRRQGLLEGLWCLNPDEKMSEGQSEELDRIYESYPHLTDDDFVRENLDEFFSSPKATS